MSKINVIRPSHLLTLFNNCDLQRAFVSEIPDGDIGSTSMLEKVCLVVLGRLVEAKSVFEFGTFKGETTKLFISNKIGESVATLDLEYFEGEISRENFDLSNDVENDRFLTRIRKASVDLEIKEVARSLGVSVELLKNNSMSLDVSHRKGRYDLIFIDGGHTSEIIENDTKLALAMLAKGGCIVWHDYGSKVHTEVTKYLDKLSYDRCLFSIGSTSIVFHSDNEKLTRGLPRR
ncbi:hypothetical protein GCM10011316_17110 [Roseibium aquae]|uniref:Class I SAM-dependent methyltransferase n=1 Tax=Roseibium aquae TaxID=1323746 RepID=A0A916WZJ6_9HYPH|nr:class I SAM-dependent methyltransferase [Roseibium aquae]GGB45621.1 hypothetical protein GCM10011316_17110 [Roseibium aquae]